MSKDYVKFLDHQHEWQDTSIGHICMRCRLSPIQSDAATSLVIQMGVKQDFPVVSENVSRQAFYVAMRLEGTSHSLAETLALQLPPGTKGTDRAYMEGRVCGNQFEKHPAIGNYYRKIANKAGVSTTGKYYSGQLARFPGDPQAWVSSIDDVKRVADKENLGVQGAVNRTSVRGITDPAPTVRMAEDLVREKVEAIVEANPDAKGQEKKIRKQVIEKHGARV